MPAPRILRNTMHTSKEERKVFDGHFHIIDNRFPLVANQGFLPDDFSCADYLERARKLKVTGGAIVSGSFQAFDQTYLVAALEELGPTFVGVTQLPASVSDEEIVRLNAAGVRAVRFNLRRGGSESVERLDDLARRVHEIAGWHVELYVDSRHLTELYCILVALPAVSIDHLGLSRSGFDTLLKLVEHGMHVKATGFGRVDFDVVPAMKAIVSVNPDALMFGTDLPSTRAARPFRDEDVNVITDAFEQEIAGKILYENAVAFYRPRAAM
ncbi:MAG TPA: amidohydrolase family protein [Candidatus Methylomirabilis sp.]|nr:amidohydrolase family protein [Candidatus Methylomirabilis sp.]